MALISAADRLAGLASERRASLPDLAVAWLERGAAAPGPAWNKARPPRSRSWPDGEEGAGRGGGDLAIMSAGGRRSLLRWSAAFPGRSRKIGSLQ